MTKAFIGVPAKILLTHSFNLHRLLRVKASFTVPIYQVEKPRMEYVPGGYIYFVLNNINQVKK